MLRSGHRWQDNIKIVLKEIGWLVVDWIHVTGFCEYRYEQSNFIKCGFFFCYLRGYLSVSEEGAVCSRISYDNLNCMQEKSIIEKY